MKEEEEERDASMADPFPDEKLRYWKVQLSIVVEMEGEEEEEEEEEEKEEEEEEYEEEGEGEMLRSDAVRVAGTFIEAEDILREWSWSSPSVW